MAIVLERETPTRKGNSYRRRTPRATQETIPSNPPFSSLLSPEGTIKMTDQEKHVLTYIDHLLEAYPEAITVWEAGQLFQPEYQNIAIHCATAGAYADVFTDLLHITGEEKHDIVLAALLHDWFKVTEIAMQDQELDTTGALSLKTLNAIKRKDAKGLESLKISKHVALLAGQNVPESTQGPISTGAKIIWFIDAMLRDQNAIAPFARFPIIDERIPQHHLSKRDRRNQALDAAYIKKYDGIRYYTLQGQLGDKVGHELAELVIEQNGTYLQYLSNEPQIYLPIFLENTLLSKVNSLVSLPTLPLTH